LRWSWKFDPHHDAPDARSADLAKARVGKDPVAADVELTPGDLFEGLRDHGVALERTSTAGLSKIDRGTSERVCHAATPVAGA
jgi:hypothetical protein